MPTNTTNTTLDDGAKAKDIGAAATSDRSFDIDSAKASLSDAARKAERAVQDGIETLRSQSRVYVDAAGERLDTAQRYVVERVKERPVTATLAGVGVGLLLGVLLTSGRNNHRAR